MNKSYVTYLHDYPTRNAVSNYPYLADNTFVQPTLQRHNLQKKYVLNKILGILILIRDTLTSKLWSLLRFFRGIFFKSKGNSQVNFMKHFLSWKKLGMRIKELFGSKILVWPCSTILRLFQKLLSPVRQKY